MLISGMMMFVKTKDRERKMAARVERKIPLTMRTPLSALKSGSKMSGIIISVTSFGAYVDIGSECDGLLHISQISNTYFVENLRKHLMPGDEVEVTIKSLNPEKKKLHLTMLPPVEDDDDDEDRIVLDEIEIDDELWGEIVRVTDYGSYVELGAEVKGFLHFMDHPLFGSEPGAHPSTYMEVGDRVRVWVSDVDRERSRVKLTANRPSHLPGPRRELL
jgi:small subunit ribosomal protein S1